MVDVNKLKKITADAIQRGKEKAAQAEAARIAKEEREKKEHLQKAERIIEQIPERAEREAALGRSHAIIMALNYEDYKRPDAPDSKNYNECKGNWLIGTAQLVYIYCADAGLTPTIEGWHDGCGVKSGFNLVVHW
jgi:hypothetical protein